eukprot:4511112-Ditylum_brightwellii.AAC.1
MATHGYFPCARTPGLWKHTYCDTTFVLCVDNFGMKYTSQANTDHLVDSIQQHYQNNEDCYVDIAVPKYVTKVLVKLGHKAPAKPEHSPHRHVKIRYGQEGQLVLPLDELPLITRQTIQYIQSIVGIFLWYARAVDLALLPTLNAIAS